MSKPSVRFILPSDPTFLEVEELRYRVLYEPFGLDRHAVAFNDADPASRHVVAFLRGELVGYGRLVISGDVAQIRHLCVSPSARRQGVGRAILEALLQRARTEGASMAFLNARLTALGLYREFGFEDTGGAVFHTEETHLPHKRMELVLA